MAIYNVVHCVTGYPINSYYNQYTGRQRYLSGLSMKSFRKTVFEYFVVKEKQYLARFQRSSCIGIRLKQKSNLFERIIGVLRHAFL